MDAKLQVKNLYKIFGGSQQEAMERLERGESKEEILEATGSTVGVQDANFVVEEGQIFVVMGLSGSGKSTLVRMLNGLIPPSSGQVMIDEDDVANCSVADLRRVRRSKISMVFQHFALFPHKSILDNVAYGLKIKGIHTEERKKRATKALEQVGLNAWANSLPSELSGGMQQRVGLARGLATDPEILLMDEPFSALDPLIRREMQDELLELQRSLKKTIIFITHDLNEALLLGDKIAIMKDGRFVQVGTAQDIVSNPADDYVSAFVADIDRGRVFSALHVADEPVAVQLKTGTAVQAMRIMEERNRYGLYVLDGDDIAGLVTYQDLSSATMDADAPNPKLQDFLITDYPSVPRDEYLADLYGAASKGLPIAVLDKKDKLIGVIEPHGVFALLSGQESHNEQTTAEPETTQSKVGAA